MREYISEYIEKKVLKLEKEFDKVIQEIKSDLHGLETSVANIKDFTEKNISEMTSIPGSDEMGVKQRWHGVQIYFIRMSDTVKIGFSKSAVHRCNALQTANPYTLELLGYFNGQIHDENQIHEELDRYRIRGEWFEFNDDVKKFIKDIIKERKGHYLTKRIDAYESPK